MLGVGQVHVIRHKVHVEGKSRHQTAREMGISRNTVKKYLEEPVPKRKRKPRSRPVLKKVQERIDELLDEWGKRTTKKQRITGSRIHQQLIEEQYEVGVTLVRQYMRERKRQRSEAYIPLVHRPGEEVQVDFFEVTVEIGGERRKAWKFLMRFMYSGKDFVWLYDRCDQTAFLDGHVRAFAHFGCVPRRAIYDNLKAAVRKVTLPKRDLSKRFQALARHYLFEPCFARPGEGHDKGGVESRGKGIRLQHMTPIPRGNSFKELSELLLADVVKTEPRRKNREGQTVRQRFEEDFRRALPLPGTPFEARKIVPVSVGSHCRVLVGGGWFSVPSHWKRLDAMAYVGPEEVEIVCRDERVSHPRLRFGRRSIRYRHYLPELAKKPQAVRQVAPELVKELGEPYGKLWELLSRTHGELPGARVLARILAAVLDHGEEAIGAALTSALETKRANLLALDRLRPAPPTVPVPEALACYEVESARAADFDVLLAQAVSA